MWLGDQFGIPIGFQGDVCSFFKHCFAVCMNSQVKDLWLAAIAALCGGLWYQRNAYKFENKNISYERLHSALVGWVKPLRRLVYCRRVLCLILWVI